MRAWFLFLPALGILLVISLLVALNLGAFHSPLEKELGTRLGAQVTLGPVVLMPKWPLQVSVGKSQVQGALYTMTWSQFKIELGSLSAPYVVHVTLLDPSVTLNSGTSVETGSSASSGSQPPAKSKAVQFKLEIKNGQFNSSTMKTSDLNLTFQQKVLMKSPAQLHAKANLELVTAGIKIPLQIDSDNLTLTAEMVKATDLKLIVSGMTAAVLGTSFVKEGRHRWKAAISAPDLAKLPEPPGVLSAQNWRGSVHLNTVILKEGPAHPWSVEGDIRAEKVTAHAKFTQDKLALHGPFQLDLIANFTHSSGVSRVSQVKGNVDLTPARIIYQDWIHKEAGVPLTLNVLATGHPEGLNLQSVDLKFWNLAARIQGKSKWQAPYESTWRAEIPSVSLKGAEKVFIPLASSPVEGQAGLTLNFAGALMDPMNAHIDFETLKFKDFSGLVNYEKPGSVKVKGRVVLSLEGRAEVLKGSIKQATLRGQVNLKEPAMVVGPLRKEAKQNLSADFLFRSLGSALEIESFGVDSFFGQLRISGKMDDWKNLAGQFKVAVKPLDLTELRMALPEYRALIPKGKVVGELRLNGKTESEKPWHQWPLDTEGTLRVTIPDYAMTPATEVVEKKLPGGTVPPRAPAPLQGFLPDGYLTSHLRLNLIVDMTQFTKDNLLIQGVRVEGKVNKGHFQGQVSVQQIFSGSLQALNLDIPLLSTRPTLAGTVKWNNVVIQDAMGFAKPAARDFAEGKMAGSSEFVSFLPSDNEFFSYLKVKGSVNMEPVTLNSVRLGQVINDLIKKVPMLKIPPVKVEPLRGSVKTDFNLAQQSMQIDQFVARDADNSELQLSGKVALGNLHGDMVGSFFWAKPQVQGCLLEGNSDSTGRMVIPVALKGDLMQPGMATLSDMLVRLGIKALQCEQKKLMERVKKDGTKQLESEVKKGLESLFGK